MRERGAVTLLVVFRVLLVPLGNKPTRLAAAQALVCSTLQITQLYSGASRQGGASSSTRATWGQVSTPASPGRQSRGALSHFRTARHCHGRRDRQPLSGVGSWRDSPAPRATPGRGRLPFTLFCARGAELVGHQSACVSPGQPRTRSGRAAPCLALRRLPPHGPLAPRCCGQVSVALLQRPLWPLPLEGSTSSRPVRQPRPRTLVHRLGGGICLPRLELVVPTCRLVGGAGGRCAPSVCVAAHGPSELVRAHSVRCVSPRGAPGFSTSRPLPLQHRYSSLGPVGRAVTVTLVPVSPALPQGAAVQCEPRTAPSSISSSLGRVIRVAQPRLPGRSLGSAPSMPCTAPCPRSGVGMMGTRGF